MTGPDGAPRPSVTTAPAEGGASGAPSPRAPLGRRRLPAHLGPARTSTVLLAVAFLAIGVLYLFVKPPEARTAGVGTDPSPTTSTGVTPTTSAPAPTTAREPTPTTEETAAPTSETAPTTSEAPEETPVEPTEESTTPEDTGPAPTTSEPVPTTAGPSS